MGARRFTLTFASGHRCSVHVGRGALRELSSVWNPSWRRAAIIGDRNVVDRYGPAVAAGLQGGVEDALLLPFSPGEAHKTRDTKAALEDQLLQAGFERDGCIIGLGGGVSLDVAGFVAATYLRGVATVYVPTSLLAQVDAAIGGKTGVNTAHGKNLIGAFYQPEAVLIDPELLRTLPAEEWPNGLAELVKLAMVADAALFEWLEQHVAEIRAPGVIDSYPLDRSAQLKGEIVTADERDGHRRGVLNFGHTIGHALESASAHAFAHGRAVAVGMLVEGWLAVERNLLPQDRFDRLAQLIGALGLAPPTTAPLPTFAELAPFLGSDKKRQRRQLRVALPEEIGTMAHEADQFTLPTTVEELRRAWHGTQGGESKA